MKNAAKLIVATGLAAIAVAGAAFAGKEWHHRGGQMMDSMAERYDANKDGKISQEEIDQNRTSRHGEFDTDKNATLSLEEFKALWLKANMDRVVREFQEFDKDGNAQVTLDEYKAPLARHVAEMDQNGDGILSKDDHEAMRDMKMDKRHEGMMDDDDTDGKNGMDDKDDSQ